MEGLKLYEVSILLTQLTSIFTFSQFINEKWLLIVNIIDNIDTARLVAGLMI